MLATAAGSVWCTSSVQHVLLMWRVLNTGTRNCQLYSWSKSSSHLYGSIQTRVYHKLFRGYGGHTSLLKDKKELNQFPLAPSCIQGPRMQTRALKKQWNKSHGNKPLCRNEYLREQRIYQEEATLCHGFMNLYKNIEPAEWTLVQDFYVSEK